MKSDFVKSVMATVALLLGLFGLAALSPALPASNASALVRELVAQSRGRRSFGGEEGNGYYENLMRGRSMNASIPIELVTVSKSARSEMHAGEIYTYGGFLLYEAKPNLDLPNTIEGPVRTNSYGLFDYEYPLQKSPGTRRIALFGDSVTRGWGMNLDQRYGNLLERKLNAGGNEHFQLVNFAEPGYVLSQILDVVRDKASAFHPDVYVLAMTNITGGIAWESHLMQLVDNGQDLKYDLLYKVAKESGIAKGSPAELKRWELAPYRQSTLREIFLEIKSLAEQRSAKVIVVLVPSAEEQDVLDAGFRPLRESLKNTGIPVIDLSHIFRGTDIEGLRKNWHDPHPNAEAHGMIAENLYNKLLENPEAWVDLTGMPVSSIKSPAQGSRN